MVPVCTSMKKILFAFILLIFFLSSAALAGPPQRIVSLAPNVTEVLYDLGLGERVIAVSTYCNYPPEVRVKPKIGGMSNPSLEAIVSLKPDVVVLTDDGNPRQIAERLVKLKIPVYAFRAKRLADLPREIRKLGIAVGAKDRAERRARTMERQIASYAGKARQTSPSAREKVLFVMQPEPLIVAGPGTAINDILNLFGAKNIAADAPAPYPRFSIEEVIRRNPDIIFMVRTQDGMENRTGQLPGKLKTLEAVRRGRVFYIGDSLLRMGPRITEGITDIAGYLKRK